MGNYPLHSLISLSKLAPLNPLATEMHLLSIVALLVCAILVTSTKESWSKPGCHKVGHTRKISIQGCLEFTISTNACRGFCTSYSVPSPTILSRAATVRPTKPVTSIGECCNIMETEDVNVSVWCLEGMRNVTFKSAKVCSCYHCKKD